MSRRRSTRTAACWVSSRSRRRRLATTSCASGWQTFGTVGRVGVEGTGAYGAGLARHLRGRGLVVIEVDRPNRQERRRQRQVRRARRDRSGAGGVVGSCVGDREVRGRRRRSDPGVVGRAPLGPQRADQVLESDPPSRLHRPRRAPRTAPGRVPPTSWPAPPPALRPTVGQRHRSCTRRSSRSRRWVDASSRSTPTPSVSTTRSSTLVRAAAPEPARGLRRRHRHRRDLVGRRRRQPAPTEERSRVRASVWRRTPTRVIGQDRPASDSTPAGTDKRTMRCGGSCSPA